MSNIYLVRHGQTDYNLKGIVQGSGVDSSLNPTGRQQSVHFYEKYRDMRFDLVITSTLKRTWETVAGFIEDGLPWEKHAQINEMSWGSHEGKLGTKESIAEYVSIKNGWGDGRIDGRIGGGESAREMGDRLQSFVDHLRGRQEENILICSHGRAMCGLVTLMMGRPITMMNELKHSNLGLWVATLRDDGIYDFSHKNDLAHLPEPQKLGKW